MTIRELREARGWLQAQLGQQVEVPVETIEHWERGLLQLDAEQLRRLGEVLHLSPHQIVLQEPIEQEKTAARLGLFQFDIQHMDLSGAHILRSVGLRLTPDHLPSLKLDFFSCAIRRREFNLARCHYVDDIRWMGVHGGFLAGWHLNVEYPYPVIVQPGFIKLWRHLHGIWSRCHGEFPFVALPGCS